ncbi:MAG: class I adenylate-forming enzyme family protein [Chloroflexota bacterium]
MTGLDGLLARFDAPGRPDEPAFLGPDGRVLLRRGELAAQIRAAAGAYARAGFAPGARVAFGVRQDADGIPWLLGAFRAGIVPVVLETGLSPATLVDRVRTAGVEAIVTDGRVATVLHHPVLRWLAARRGLALPAPRELAEVTWTTSFAPARVRRLDRLAGGDARRSLDGRAPALVVFTSGTTGAPRGVVYGGDGLAALMEAAERFIELPGDAVVLGSALHLTVPALLAGVPVVLADPRDPARLAAMVRRLGISHVSLPAQRALAFARAGGRTRLLLLGSAPVRNVTLRELVELMPGTEIRLIYGMSEYLLVAAMDAGERLAYDERGGDLVGRPIGGVRLRIATDGELHVGGPALALGYLGGALPVDELASGDIARFDASGRLVLVGRRKEMLIRTGENIYPALYEALLADGADLDAAVMVGLPDVHADEMVVLFAVPRAGQDPEAARARLASLVASPASPLDRHARPDVILGLEVLPRSGRSGKPDRRELVRIAAARLGRPAPDDPLLPEQPA